MCVMETVRVVIADDHPIFRAGLREVLRDGTRYRVEAEYADGRSALEGIRHDPPAIALLDLEMPELSGLDLAVCIREETPHVAIVLLTMHDEAEALLRALQVGVDGYVLKDNAVADLINCLDAVMRGELFVSPSLEGYMSRVSQPLTADAADAVGSQRLTCTERKVLRLIAHSRTSPQIAEELFISVRTVHHHRENIARKLGLSGSNALALYAIRNKTFL